MTIEKKKPKKKAEKPKAGWASVHVKIDQKIVNKWERYLVKNDLTKKKFILLSIEAAIGKT